MNPAVFKFDPIFKLFHKWFQLAIASQKTPTTGTVTGDTWLYFRRAYGRSATIWFVVDEIGGEEPIQGSVHQNGRPETVYHLSVHNIPTVRRIVAAESNCVRVHLELFLFSLLVSELDGIPIAEHVKSVISPTKMNAAWLLSKVNHLSTWPQLSHVPSYKGGRPTKKSCGCTHR